MPSSLIRGLCERSGLSQAELARRAGMPASVVSAYVNGHREPGVEAVQRLATAAGLRLTLTPVQAPVDTDRAARILEQVLDLAEAFPPRRTRAPLAYPGVR